MLTKDKSLAAEFLSQFYKNKPVSGYHLQSRIIADKS